MTTLKDVPGTVLLNRGVPVQVWRLATDPLGNPVQPYERAEDGARDEVWVRMDAMTLALIEEKWGSADAWGDALGGKRLCANPKSDCQDVSMRGLERCPRCGGTAVRTVGAQTYLTIVDTLALCLDWDRKRVGRALIEGETTAYETAIGVAFMIANGANAETAGKALRTGIKATSGLDVAAHMAKALDDLEALSKAVEDETAAESESTSATPGATGWPAGSESAEPSTSSGG